MPTDRKEKISFDTHAGKKLRNRRIQLKLTQTDVAHATNKTFQQVQKYEKGSNACPKWNELKLCELFGCDSDYFVKPLIENNYKFITKRERNGYADSNRTWT